MKANPRSKFLGLWRCLLACHRYCGATRQEAEVLVVDVADTTLKRYQRPFKLLIRHGIRTGVPPTRLTPAELSEVPIFRWAALVKAFALTCQSNARQAYAALLLFPSFHHLRFEQSLKTLKKFWNISLPKYSSFYDFRVLLMMLVATDFTVSEEALWLRAIITMRILSLFRGIDLARTARDIQRGAWCLLRQLSTQRQVGSSTLSCSQAPAGGGMPSECVGRLHRRHGRLHRPRVVRFIDQAPMCDYVGHDQRHYHQVPDGAQLERFYGPQQPRSGRHGVDPAGRRPPCGLCPWWLGEL